MTIRDSTRKVLIRDDEQGRSQEALTLRMMLRDSARMARSLRMMIGTQLKNPASAGFSVSAWLFLQGAVILLLTCGHTFIAFGVAGLPILGRGCYHRNTDA